MSFGDIARGKAKLPIRDGLLHYHDISMDELHGWKADGANVQSFKDASYEGHTLTQLNPALAPHVKTNSSLVQYRSALVFETGDVMTMFPTTPTFLQPLHIFVVCRPPALVAGSPRRLFDRATGWFSCRFYETAGGEQGIFLRFGKRLNGVTDPLPGTWQLVEVVADGTNSQIWQNGVRIVVGDAGTNSWYWPYWCPVWGGGGNLAACATFDHELSDDHAVEMRDYFARRFLPYLLPIPDPP